MKKKLLQYGFCGIFGALMAYWVMQTQGLFQAGLETVDTVAILCNAFFVPGILLACLGALLWVATTGFFDSIGYAFRAAGHLLLPFLRIERKTYYDYKTEKAEKRSQVPGFIFHVGGFYMALSLICLAIWYAL